MKARELRQFLKKELNKMLLKGFANITLISISVLIIAVFLGIYGYFTLVKKSEPSIFQPTAAPNISPSQTISSISTSAPAIGITPASTSTQDEYAEWKTYRNEEYGFEIDYPTKEWECGWRAPENPSPFVCNEKKEYNTVFDTDILFISSECFVGNWNWEKMIEMLNAGDCTNPEALEDFAVYAGEKIILKSGIEAYKATKIRLIHVEFEGKIIIIPLKFTSPPSLRLILLIHDRTKSLEDSKLFDKILSSFKYI